MDRRLSVLNLDKHVSDSVSLVRVHIGVSGEVRHGFAERVRLLGIGATDGAVGLSIAVEDELCADRFELKPAERVVHTPMMPRTLGRLGSA